MVLHDARVLSQSWERLVISRDDSALVPEARTLLAVAVQRLNEAAAGPTAAALASLLDAFAVTVDGATAFDAVDQLVRDPGGLVRARLTAALPEVSSAVSAALGLPDVFDLGAGTVHLDHTSTGGRFGWSADVTAGPAGLTGTVAIGPSSIGPGAAAGPAGALRLIVDLAPYAVRLSWQRPSGDVELVELWPQPDAPALARPWSTRRPAWAAMWRWRSCAASTRTCARWSTPCSTPSDSSAALPPTPSVTCARSQA